MSFGLRFRLYLNFPGKVALILGICQSILAILDIVLAVAGFIQKIWGHYYATGIWCGLVVFIDGLCGILASQTRTGLGVKTFFAVSTLSAIVTFIMVILSFGGLDFRSNFYDRTYLYTDQRGQATKAVHGSLLALGLVEFIVSIINAAMCLKPTCSAKSEWTYTHSKTKSLHTHESSLNKNSDIPHGFMGGNPDSVPPSEQPMIRRYRSPRHANGSGFQRSDRGTYTEPTETSEFLPRKSESYNHHIDNETEGRKQRRSSREPDDVQTYERGKIGQGRVFGRQSNRRRSEGNEGKRRHHPEAELSLDRSTVPRRHNARAPKHHQVSNEGESSAARNEREHGLQRNDSWRERELASYRQPSGLMSYDSWERRNQGRQDGTVEKAGIHRRQRSESREPERSNSFRDKGAPNIEQSGDPNKLQKSDSCTENRGLARRNSDKRPSSERTSSFREITRDSVPYTKVKNNIGFGQQMTVSNPNKPNGPLYVKNSSLNTRTGTKPSVYDGTPFSHSGVKGSDKMKRESFSMDQKGTPLQRSIGSRGSYSAAVNLMPTESMEHLPNLITQQTKNSDHIPPTAFGEEDLPGYEEFQANDSHVYSSVSSLSARVTDRLRLEHGSGSAELSVADEEVQEILGTTSNEVQNNSSELANIDSNPDEDNNPRRGNTKEPARTMNGRTEEKQRMGPTSRVLDEQHNMRTLEVRSQKTTDSRTTSQDRLTDEVSLALPSPMRSSPAAMGSSPAFARGQRTRASDRFPDREPDDIPEIGLHKSFRASFPQRKSDKDRNPRRWGISVSDHSEKSASPETLLGPIQNLEEENDLSELSTSFPLLSAVGGIDFGISDRDSYLEVPDSTVYSFSYDEVKPRVFPTSPYRTPRKTSPLTLISVPRMPSSEEELEGRIRVIETVNVGVASPPHHRRNQPKQASFHDRDRLAPKPVDISTSDTKLKPESQWKELVPVNREQTSNNLASAALHSVERQAVKSSAAPSKYFYPPERLPSRVGVNTHPVTVNSQETKRQEVLPTVGKETQNYEQLSMMASGGPTRSTNTQEAGGLSRPPAVPKLSRCRPEDSDVAFRALHDTLSDRTVWERQTYPPLLLEQSATQRQQPRGREAGRSALRKVMRSEQAAQEEPLEQRAHLRGNNTDARLNTRRYAVPFAPEPSAPSTGGPPPYSEVAPIVSHVPSDRAPHQPHSTGRTSHPSPNRTERPRRQPVFSLVL